MKKSQKLLLGRNIFTFIIIMLFTIIILNEKGGTLFLPKAEDKINTYIEENFSDIKDEIILGKTTYKKTEYYKKIKNKENSHLYFYINYKNKKLSDTYKKDYLEGNTLLTHIKKNMEKEINTKTKEKCSIKIISTLNKFTPKVKERIINEDNLLQLKFFAIEKELIINNWNENEISEEITNFIKTFQNNNIKPKYYTVTITDNKDITKSIKIDNLTDNFTVNTSKKEIIRAIINDEKSELLTNEKIKYTYLN